MAYATAAELTEHLGVDRYTELADRDQDGSVDAAAVTQALDSASSIADSYVTRYLPIAVPPRMLVDAVLEIAVYKLAGNRSTSDERQRYEDALAWLKDVGAKRASLNLPEGAITVPSGDVIVDAPDAQMRFDQTRRIM